MEQIKSKEMEQLRFDVEETDIDHEETMLIFAEKCFASSSSKEWRVGIKWLEKAASRGQIEAMYQLGSRLWDGNQVKQNKENAIGWILRAAHRGHAEAMYKISKCFYYGELLSPDKAEAEWWLRQAAEAGNHEASEELENGRQQHQPLHRTNHQEKGNKKGYLTIFVVAMILLLVILAIYQLLR